MPASKADHPSIARSSASRPRRESVDRHVASRIRERRRTLGLSQQELATLAG